MLIPKKLFENVRFPDGRLYEDEAVLLNEASAIFPQTILAKENLCIDIDGGTVYEK